MAPTLLLQTQTTQRAQYLKCCQNHRSNRLVSSSRREEQERRLGEAAEQAARLDADSAALAERGAALAADAATLADERRQLKVSQKECSRQS